jgi:hypothetical protein
MKKFIIRLILILITFTSINLILIYFNKPNWQIGQEIVTAKDLILTAGDEDKVIDTVRIGDSVGKNLIGTKLTNKTLSLGTNQAISFLGQLLIYRKCKNNFQNSDHKLVFEGYIRPSSFYSGLNQKYTFNYFIKHFYNEDWLFNSTLLSEEVSMHVDQSFLSSYRLKSCVSNTWFNGFTVFSFPMFGSTVSNVKNKKEDLLSFLLPHMIDLKNEIQFVAMPIHRDNYTKELDCYLKLKDLGFKIKKPFLLNDSFFVCDKIHLKPQFREQNIVFKYKKD